MNMLVEFVDNNIYIINLLPKRQKLYINKATSFFKYIIVLMEKYTTYLEEDTYTKIVISIKTCIMYRLFGYTLSIIQLKDLYNKEPNVSFLYVLWLLSVYIFIYDWILLKGSIVPIISIYLTLSCIYYNSYDLAKSFYIPLTMYELPALIYKYQNKHLLFRTLLYIIFLLHIYIITRIEKGINII